MTVEVAGHSKCTAIRHCHVTSSERVKFERPTHYCRGPSTHLRLSQGPHLFSHQHLQLSWQNSSDCSISLNRIFLNQSSKNSLPKMVQSSPSQCNLVATLNTLNYRTLSDV